MKHLVQSLCLAALFWWPGAAMCESTVPENGTGGQGIDAEGSVLHVQVANQPITPVLTRYIRHALDEAESSGVQCIVIELDTPGGLVESTQQMVKDIIGSSIPVVVYVSPSGARAASGGVFVTLAAHIAAMAPGTRIGAAHPVSIGGGPVGGSPEREGGNTEGAGAEEKSTTPSSDPMADKIMNDTRAWAKALAELRGRNAEWAELAVTESRSITAKEAVELNVVDLIATNMTDLLQKIDKREVKADDRLLTLHTREAPVRHLTMWWGDRLLSAISNPNIAFLLLIFGFYGLLFELHTPGWGVAGTLGAICLVLAFFGLAVLPVNYAGLALIGVALAMFAAEAFVTSFGALTVGGIVCLILGGLMLVESPAGFLRVSLSVVVPVAIATAAITVFLVTRIVAGRHSPVQTGDQSLQGAKAVADGDFIVQDGTYTGTVRIHGELWKATSSCPVAAGETMVVIERSGLVLAVEPVEESEEST